MKVIIFRHGKDDDRYRGGWSNSDLTADGIMQIKRLAKCLCQKESEFNFTRIVSSDLCRAMSTARLLAAELRLPITGDPEIREINNGDLAGMSNDEAILRYPGLYFNTLGMDEPYPNGESPRIFYERIKTWFERFVTENKNIDGDILVVTHGGVVNIIYHIAKNIEWSNKGCPFKLSDSGILVLNIDTMEIETKQFL